MAAEDDPIAARPAAPDLSDSSAAARAADAAFVRSVLGSSNACIQILDLHCRLVFISEGGQRVMEVSDPHTLEGRHWPDFWHGPGHAAATAAVATARAGGVGRFQARADTMAGRTRWWDVEVSPILGEAGQSLRFLAISRDITELKLAESQLQQALSLNASIMESSRDCTVVLDLEGHTLHVSSGGIESMEIADVSSILGLLWLRVWSGVDHAKATAALAVARYGGVGRFQGFCATHRGTPKWWDVVITPLLGADGRPERLVSVGRDITALKQTEQRLALSEERLNLALGASGVVGIWDWDLTNDLVHADRNFAEIYSVDPAWAARGAPLTEFTRNFHPDDAPAFQRELDRVFAGADTFSCEYRVRQGDGSFRWVLARGRLVRDAASGKPVRFPGATVDVTDLKRTEHALQQLNETLELRVQAAVRERDRAWDQSRDLQVICDVDGQYLSVNAAWERLTGWTADELVGHSYREFVHADDLDNSRDALARAGSEGIPGFENRHLHKQGGYRWISWMVSANDGLVYASGRDVTADKEAAAALDTMQEQLRQSQKMEAVGQLTGGLAHDFNNLLAGITGSLELLQRRIAQGRVDDYERHILSARGSARRAAALTHRLLAFSRRQTLESKPVDLNRLVGGMEELTRRTIGPAITLEVVGAGGLWLTNVDAHQLENALLNLCINARDAMPHGGRLTIETANKWLDDRGARERDLAPGQYVSLCVTDTGSGMPPEIIKRVFEPFFTTKPIGMGTGLGLSMVYGFARQSGGQVRVYSEVGMGTTMCIYLPRLHGGEAEAAEDVEARPVVSGQVTGTVLVVDDETTVRSVVVDVLQELGYATLEAENGAQALTLLQSSAPIDLLITDVGLPGGMNGRQVADAGRALRSRLKVMFITGYAENAVIGNGHMEPEMRVLTKPFTLDGLAVKVSELMAAG